MELFNKYIINEFVKLSRHKSIILTILITLFLSVAFAYMYSSDITQRKDFLIQQANTSIGGFFRFYTIFIYPITSLLFIWSVDLEEDKNAFNWLRIGILKSTTLKVAKFLVAYTIQIILVGVSFLAFYFLFVSEITSHPINDSSFENIQSTFFNNAQHFLLLSTPLNATVFLISFYIRKFYVGIASLILLHLISIFIFSSWAMPFHGLHKAIGIEAVLTRGWNTYTRQDIVMLYRICVIYVLFLLSIDLLLQRTIINHTFRYAS